MKFLETPNPNARKIEISHNFEVSINISEDELLNFPKILALFKMDGIENIFTGPDFITVMKNSNFNWENIIQDFNNNLDNM
jgi:hypothetical protein|tara:strand:- start:249 stop:491 length:243 start_codon:yes stop_codon:yes gene_type:complete